LAPVFIPACSSRACPLPGALTNGNHNFKKQMGTPGNQHKIIFFSFFDGQQHRSDQRIAKRNVKLRNKG
jgi:hypothetical protein